MRTSEIQERAIVSQIRKHFAQKAEQVSSGRLIGPMTNRRTFLLGMSAAGLPLTAIAGATPAASPFASPATRISSDPFTLGVASGEPLPDGVVLWTRIAPEPFAENGGVSTSSVRVTWEIGSDDAMRYVLQTGTYQTDAAWAHSVHVEVSGLEPATPYWYRFRVEDWESPVGRTKTAPAAGASDGEIRFAFASCQRWDQGLYHAFADMAAQEPDLIVHLGDYIYEMAISMRGALRDHPLRQTRDIGFSALGEIYDLDDYRQRYALYKRDSDLQAAHQIAPWMVTWDDHEVANNYFGAILRDEPAAKMLLERRQHAYQAYWEHMPLREAQRPLGTDLQLYRAADFGDLVRFNVLDTRQYRSPQIGQCLDAERGEFDGYCENALDPARTMLGEAQKDWLFDGFGETSARWNVLAQQVPFSRIDLDPDPRYPAYGDREMDKWDAYAAEREEVLNAMSLAAETQGFQPIVITGDVHRNYVWDMKDDWDAPRDEHIIGTEFVGTSIASNGDEPLAENGAFTTVCGEFNGNPHNRLYDDHRGYVMIDLSAEKLMATYRVASTVERDDVDMSTLAMFQVTRQRPGAESGDCAAG